MCNFKPGDEVICIAGGDWIGRAPQWMFWTRSHPIDGPVKGQTYVIERVGMGVAAVTGCEVVGVSLVGVAGAWPAVRFRKVQRRDIGAWLETSTDFEEPKRTPAEFSACDGELADLEARIPIIRAGLRGKMLRAVS